MRVTRGRRTTGAALMGAALPLLVLPGAPARAAEDPVCGATDVDTPQRTVTGANAANDALQVPAATALVRKAGRRPGEGVTVVVVDTQVPGGVAVAPRPDLVSSHGLTAAGIVGGPEQGKGDVAVGIAPAADVRPVRFYDAERGSAADGEAEPEPGALASALAGISVGRRTVVLVPAVVGPGDSLRSALERLARRGALVIAPSGDRPQQADGLLDDYVGDARPGQDAAADVWPAAVDDAVLAVGLAPPLSSLALRNSEVDLAAPGVGAVSIGAQGGWCRVTEPSTAWAAAQVAGVAALVWSVHRDDSAAELRARLEGTASGNGEASPLTGYGVVQPVEALQRPLESLAPGDQRAAQVPRGDVPPQRADLLADTRHDAVWWGLGGGGALVVLLVLRPALARRRR
jgi:membrane-anchored mycosin MYCP